jgi:hypothetical protein
MSKNFRGQAPEPHSKERGRDGKRKRGKERGAFPKIIFYDYSTGHNTHEMQLKN